MIGTGVWATQTALRPPAPWQATRNLLRRKAGAIASLPGVMSSPPVVSVGAADTSAIAGSNITLVEDEATRLWIGGRFYKYPFAGTNWATWNSVHLNGVDDDQLGGAVEFVTTAVTFEIVVNAGGKLFQIWVNDQLVQADPFQPGSGVRFYKVRFAGSATRKIRVAFMNGISWQGIKLPEGEAIFATAPEAPIRCLVAGDSFVEGAGAVIGGQSAYGLLGFANVAALGLGIDDLWSSGSGGTGWVQTNGSRVNLTGRLASDVIGPAPNVVVIAMGMNDADAAAAGTNAAAALTSIRAALPGALIYVVGPWDPWAPDPMPSSAMAVRAAVSAASSGRAGVWFFDPSGLPFSRASGDITHPSRAGHQTLGVWLANQIRTELRLAGLS